jgi:hypothetical protein
MEQTFLNQLIETMPSLPPGRSFRVRLPGILPYFLGTVGSQGPDAAWLCSSGIR